MKNTVSINTIIQFWIVCMTIFWGKSLDKRMYHPSFQVLIITTKLHKYTHLLYYSLDFDHLYMQVYRVKSKGHMCYLKWSYNDVPYLVILDLRFKLM